MRDSHEEPANDYERMLDRYDLACHYYACWLPARFLEPCEGEGGAHEHKACEVHVGSDLGPFHRRTGDPIPLES